jgi:hypothetical protein
MVEEETFVVSGDRRVNAYVASIVHSLAERILEVITPISIILYGSFGRGEGTVRYQGGAFKIISDFEIGIVSRNVFRLSAIRKLNRNLLEEGADVTLSFLLPKRFTTLVTSNWALPSKFPTLEQYELLSGLRVLYGVDPRPNRIIASSSSIMPWDALRLVFNRVAELLASLIETFSTPQILKPSNKLLIACGDAALILVKAYHYSYQERSLRLQSILDGVPPESWPLDVNWDCVMDAYRWKLNPTRERAAVVPLQVLIWEILVPILRFYTKEVFGWTFQDIEDFHEQYLNSPMLEYCSRSFAGHPFLQSALIAIKHKPFPHNRNSSYPLWKAVHKTYADLVSTLASLCSEHSLYGQLGSELAPVVTSEIRAKSQLLLRDWSDLCSVL